MQYEAVIGLEIHAQLQTASKMFCGCSTAFGAPPTRTCVRSVWGCPARSRCSTARPSTTPFAPRSRSRAGSTRRRSSRARTIFIPICPKGYQISQYEQPLASRGAIEFGVASSSRRVGITRVHLEEDAGKLLHEGFPDSNRKSYVDYNRSGTPLIEIVTDPDLRSAADAADCFSRLRAILVWLGVNDGNMEEGSLRCDANVSVRPVGADVLGTKAEVKNLNSFRFLQKALEYEIDRQIDLLAEGGRVVQETRLWDSAAGVTVSMRSKEEAHDYRYFPEPDLPPLVVQPGQVTAIRGAMPEAAGRAASAVRGGPRAA
jgi:aspartyl-tRNA(Asn)/glutamyl-tRNA(Gln) amidotransferase subunit B